MLLYSFLLIARGAYFSLHTHRAARALYIITTNIRPFIFVFVAVLSVRSPSLGYPPLYSLLIFGNFHKILRPCFVIFFIRFYCTSSRRRRRRTRVGGCISLSLSLARRFNGPAALLFAG